MIAWPNDISLYQSGNIKGAELYGYDKSYYFDTSHSPTPLRKSWFSQIFIEHYAKFIDNINYKFRSREQFLPLAAHTHFAIKNKLAHIFSTNDNMHFSVNFCQNASKIDALTAIKELNQNNYRFMCINDFGSLRAVLPKLSDYLNEICGPVQDFEEIDVS